MRGTECRKVGRGQPVTEAITKGSISYWMMRLRDAFYKTFARSDDSWLYIVEVFTDHLIASDETLPHDEFYYVPYTQNGQEFSFAPRDEWEVVELTYQPRTLSERMVTGDAKSLVEVSKNSAWLGEAAPDGGPRIIYADGAVADTVNANGRLYPLPVLKEAVASARKRIADGEGLSRAVIVGEAEHPNEKGLSKFTETFVVWRDVWLEGATVKLRGTIIENQEGKDAIVTMEAGVMPGVSLRGFGEAKTEKVDGRKVSVIQWLEFKAFDLVNTPSFDIAVTHFESKEDPMADMQKQQPDAANGSGGAPTPAAGAGLTVDALFEQHPDLVQAVLERNRLTAQIQEAKAAEEQKKRDLELRQLVADKDAKLRAALGLDDTADVATAVTEASTRLRDLELAEQKRTIKTYVENQVKALPYPDDLKAQMLEAVGDPATLDEAKTSFAHNRKLMDAVVSKLRLRAKGMAGMDVLGPVIEGELGVPEFARASWEIVESMRKRNYLPEKKDGSEPKIQDRLLAQYLEAFDKTYKHHLAAEANVFSEAEQTTDLNLPYSVSRAIIEAAYPRMISAVIFDYAIEAGSPVNVYYEDYAEDSTITVAITSESFTSVHNTEVQLAHKRIIPGTVTITSSPAGTTYTEGSHYVINYAEGRITALSGGTMANSTAFLANYSYMHIREGQMAPIRRAKGTMNYVVLNHFADRLATQISREVVVFSRSQLGLDAVTRTINLLSKEVAAKIDGDRFQQALSVAMGVANNIVGPWASSTDTLAALVAHIGTAKIKVVNRNYEPSFVLVSATNSDRLSNWDGFTAAGAKPSDDLNANGYVGRMKGLPVFETTNFRDDFILVGNSEIVQARVFQPMQIRGPFPTIDASTGLLIAADQYFIEEFNGMVSPVPGKASVVKLT